jgi:hypothetical protein
MDKETMNAWLDRKAAEYNRKHEFALQSLFTDIKAALDKDIDFDTVLNAIK